MGFELPYEGQCKVLAIGRSDLKFPYQKGLFNINCRKSCRDLGVFISNDLMFTNHCTKITYSGHYRRRQFYQAFASKDRNFQVYLFCTNIRPMLESNSIVWNPPKLADIDKLENVQRKFSKYITSLFNASYIERLIILGIETLEARRVKADLVYLNKIAYE